MSYSQLLLGKAANKRSVREEKNKHLLCLHYTQCTKTRDKTICSSQQVEPLKIVTKKGVHEQRRTWAIVDSPLGPNDPHLSSLVKIDLDSPG